MATPVVYADLNLARTQGPKHASPLPRPPDACQCPRWHQWALRLGCAGLILLVLSVIGLSVSVQIFIQKTSVQKINKDIQENRTDTTERPTPFQCPRDWHSHQDKCLSFSQASGPWNEGLTDCSAKEATLLLVQDQEELKLIQDLGRRRGHLFWIGLSYKLPDKKWRWINGSILHSDILQITGEAKENSCAVISQIKSVSETCSSDNYWICEKKLKPV
ncbi:killer cell lectin-like receptor subfamily B member 1B allele B [Nannospalax galili]|uniref:killer cell lectin-like receptor subfamily B member 1B allele B n=1 Tax=Nannospalax galili TaxID=1026970 RepID=UPI00111C6338|nr:killer cell lectin-like receptor subfamily B member 1B allele B [Nannospalax galili]